MTKPFTPPPRPDLVTEQLLFDIETEKMTPEQFSKGIARLKALMDDPTRSDSAPTKEDTKK